jgi:hypothetical protein
MDPVTITALASVAVGALKGAGGSDGVSRAESGNGVNTQTFGAFNVSFGSGSASSSEMGSSWGMYALIGGAVLVAALAFKSMRKKA